MRKTFWRARIGNPEFAPLRMSKVGYVYIVANMKRGIMYIGVTSNLVGRASKNGVIDDRTRRLV